MRRLSNQLLLPLGLVALGVVLWRALSVSITHDEAFTYLHYGRLSWGDILLFKGPPLANNHVLNTLLLKLSTQWFGVESFALRLPNILFAGLYFFYAALLAKKFTHPLSTVMAFLILCAQPYLFDFFALARGYGMALALLLGAVYHLYEYRNVQNGNHTYRTLIFAGLATYANLTFLYAYLALAVLLLLLAFAEGEDRHGWLRLVRAELVVSLVLGLLIYLPLTRIQGDLTGGDSGFWQDTVLSLTAKLGYHPKAWVELIWQLAMAVLLVLGLLGTIYDLFIKSEVRRDQFYHIILFWIVLILFVSTGLHFLLDVPWLQGRMALVYVPLFLSLVIFMALRLIIPSAFNWVPKIAMALIAAGLLLHFAHKFDPKSTLDWNYDSSSKQVYQTLQEDREEQAGSKSGGAQPKQVFTHWLYEPSLNFYRISKKAEWLDKIERKDYFPADYLLLDTLRQDSLYQEIPTDDYRPIETFSPHLVLMKRRDRT